jgi:hypothetical protein
VTQKGARSSHAFRAIQTLFGVNVPNDGVVPLASANRGRTEPPDRVWPVDHAGLIGWNLDRIIPAGFLFADTAHVALYDEIIENLL